MRSRARDEETFSSEAAIIPTAREMPTGSALLAPQMKGPPRNSQTGASDGHAAMGLHSGDTRAARKRSVFAIYPCRCFGFRAYHPVR
jgi:hypothetical protein